MDHRRTAEEVDDAEIMALVSNALQARIAQGESAREIARAIHVTPRSIENWLARKNPPQAHLFLRLAAYDDTIRAGLVAMVARLRNAEKGRA